MTNDGPAIMEGLMGSGHMEHRKKTRNAFNDALQDYSADVCFGRVWARPGLDKKQRSILTVAMLTALNRPNQLAHHIEGALNMGWTPDELKEVLLQAAVYCGLPSAADAFRVAEGVLKKRELVK